MHVFILKRLIQAIPVLFLVTIIVFSMMFILPGCPARTMLGEEASPEEVANLRRAMGLDRPVVVQYVEWVGNLLQGDFGRSLQDGRQVFPTLITRLPATIELLIASLIVSFAIGIPIGIISSLRRNKPSDIFGRIFALLGISMPNFWVGLMLILVFSYHLQWLPATGRGTIANLILPALALGTASAGLITRLMRSTMLEVIGLDYIRTARAKGLRKSIVVYKHALKNALLPVLTVVGLQMGYGLGGSVITETVFAYPGIGRFAYQRLMQRDFPMIMGNLLLFAIMFIVINIIIDILYGFLDPRIRYD